MDGRIRRMIALALVWLLIVTAAACAPAPTNSAQEPGQPAPATAAPAVTPTGAPTATPALSVRIDRYLSRLADQGRFSGVVLVAAGGQVRFTKAYGLADREHGTANTPQTRFRIASLTKQFTAMAILLLQNDGKLKLDETICRYLTPCPAGWSAISIHQLLTHTSGIADRIVDLHGPTTPEQLLAVVSEQPPAGTPGAEFIYSNSGYVILGAIIEQVSGQSYADFLAQRIFEPLGMADTGFEQQPGVAIGYAGQAPAETIDPSILFAAGGLVSSAPDLYRWSQALDDDRLFPAELRALMFQPHVALHGRDENFSYAYGWFIDAQEGVTCQSHSGEIPGYLSQIMRFPERGVTIILLCNQQELGSPFLASEPIARWLIAEP